jgi:hypothetical protein
MTVYLDWRMNAHERYAGNAPIAGWLRMGSRHSGRHRRVGTRLSEFGRRVRRLETPARRRWSTRKSSRRETTAAIGRMSE